MQSFGLAKREETESHEQTEDIGNHPRTQCVAACVDLKQGQLFYDRVFHYGNPGPIILHAVAGFYDPSKLVNRFF